MQTTAYEANMQSAHEALVTAKVMLNAASQQTMSSVKAEEARMTYRQALTDLEAARGAVFSVLKNLEGQERQEGIRAALEAGIGATELAKGIGISRARVYQLAQS